MHTGRIFIHAQCIKDHIHWWGCGVWQISMVTSHSWIPVCLIWCWPTFTPTWLIIDLLSDKGSLSFSLFWENKFVYLAHVYCYSFHSSNKILLLHERSVQLCASFLLLWQRQIMNHYWYALIACRLRGRFVVQFTATKEANQSPRNDTGLTSQQPESSLCSDLHTSHGIFSCHIITLHLANCHKGLSEVL